MSSASDLQDEFIQFLESCPDNCAPDSAVQQKFSGGRYEQLVPVINALVGQRRLHLLQGQQQVHYKVVSVDEARKYQDLDQEHMLALQEIKAAGNKGVWTRTIKLKTKLQQQVLAKILKNLESRRLIKAVKSISSKHRKLYMMYDLEPAREHTGGPWYTDQEFDEEFVSIISAWILHFVKENEEANTPVTTQQIALAIQTAKITKVELSVEDIQLVMDTLVFDGAVEPDHSSSEDKPMWKSVSTVDPVNHFTETPCGVCPVFEQCTEGGLISPARCVYMNQWLGADGSLF